MQSEFANVHNSAMSMLYWCLVPKHATDATAALNSKFGKNCSGLCFGSGFMGAGYLCGFASCLVGYGLKEHPCSKIQTLNIPSISNGSSLFHFRCASRTECVVLLISSSGIRGSFMDARGGTFVCFYVAIFVLSGLLSNCADEQVSDCYTQSRDFDPYVAQAQMCSDSSRWNS